MSRTHPSTNQTATPLFHAVSPMISPKGCLIRYLPQHCLAVLDTLAQLQMILPGFQPPAESPLILSTSSLQAGLKDTGQGLTSKPTMNQANTWEGIGPGGRMPATSAQSWPRHPSSAPHQVTNDPPQSVPVQICKLTQELMRILDQLFYCQLSSSDQDISTIIAQPPPYFQPFFPKGRLCWLVAILQLLQNTAWDQWCYRNGLS